MRLLLALAMLVPLAAGAQQPLVVGSMGDSISTGFNSYRFGDNRDYSWATGTAQALNSYQKRLGHSQGRPVVAHNHSIAGSVAADLERQTTRMLRDVPDYVTITIGANDVCGWGDGYDPQLRAYETDVRRAIERLVQANPAVKIVLAPIPSLYNLWEVGSQQPQCQQRWDMFGVCRPLLGRNVSPQQRAAFVSRWEAANLALERIAFDHVDHVLFDPEVAYTRFEWRHLSTMDCFHPSVEGQNLLAEMAWQMLLARD